ncbi:unnamed protein product [Amoebophrya sp. A120]|nr:unnamed protein product [Amoebophrya sp. A120]|eukprot:GSA120T00021328001.1
MARLLPRGNTTAAAGLHPRTAGLFLAATCLSILTHTTPAAAVYDGYDVDEAAAKIDPVVHQIAKSYALLEVETGNNEVGICGGTVISKTAALTAAHCVQKFGVEAGSLAKWDPTKTQDVQRLTVFTGSDVSRLPSDELLEIGRKSTRGLVAARSAQANRLAALPDVRVLVKKPSLQVTEFDFRRVFAQTRRQQHFPRTTSPTRASDGRAAAAHVDVPAPTADYLHFFDSSWVKRPKWSHVEKHLSSDMMHDACDKSLAACGRRCCKRRGCEKPTKQHPYVYALRELLQSQSDVAVLDFSAFHAAGIFEGFFEADAVAAPVLGMEGSCSADGCDLTSSTVADSRCEEDEKCGGATDEGTVECDEAALREEDENEETSEDDAPVAVSLGDAQAANLREEILQRRKLLSRIGHLDKNTDETFLNGLKLITLGHGLTERTTNDVLMDYSTGREKKALGRRKSSTELRFRELDVSRSLGILGLCTCDGELFFEHFKSFWKDLGWRFFCASEEELQRRSANLHLNDGWTRHLAAAGKSDAFPITHAFRANLLHHGKKLGIPPFEEAVLHGRALDTQAARLTGAGDSGSGLFMVLPDKSFYLIGITKSNTIAPCKSYQPAHKCPHADLRNFRPSQDTVEHLRKYHPGTVLDQFTDLRCGVFQDFLQRKLTEIRAREAERTKALAQQKRILDELEREEGLWVGKTVEVENLLSEKGKYLNGRRGVVLRRTGGNKSAAAVNKMSENDFATTSSSEDSRSLSSRFDVQLFLPEEEKRAFHQDFMASSAVPAASQTNPPRVLVNVYDVLAPPESAAKKNHNEVVSIKVENLRNVEPSAGSAGKNDIDGEEEVDEELRCRFLRCCRVRKKGEWKCD